MLLSPRHPSPAPAAPLRPLPSRRAGRLRVAWFVLGTLFGAGLANLSMHFTSSTALSVAQPAAILPAPEPFEATAQQSALPAAEPPVAEAPTAEAPAAQPLEAAAPEALPAEGEKPALVLPATLNLAVRSGDTLISVLTDNGIAQDEALEVVETIRRVYNPRKLSAGQALTLQLGRGEAGSDQPVLSGMSLEVSPLSTVTLERSDKGDFLAKEIKAPLYKGHARAGGVIRSSLYQTGINSGLSPQLINEIIQAFSYDVDFQRDIKQGDELDVVFDEMHTKDGTTASIGSMLYASLKLGNKTLTIYRHQSGDGFVGYYNAKGESVKKALLKTPINGARITSGFGMRRHPLLGYSKMHKGVDFGAPTGTPIYAAGDGIVTFAGRKGGYGNYVQVKHNNTYATAYGHASRIASGIRPGARVKQGQIIAYVGSTGASTGPHLHYEILAAGAQVNPSGVKFRTGQTLAGKDAKQFKAQVKMVDGLLASLPRKQQLAMLR